MSDEINDLVKDFKLVSGALIEKDREVQQLKQELESMTNKCAELNYDKNCLISDLNQQRFNNQHNLSIDQKVSDEIELLKQQLEVVEKENRGLRMTLNHVAGIEHICEDLEVKLAEAVEVIEKAKFSSGFFIDDHNSKNTYLLASEFLAKYKSLENNVTEN